MRYTATLTGRTPFQHQNEDGDTATFIFYYALIDFFASLRAGRFAYDTATPRFGN